MATRTLTFVLIALFALPLSATEKAPLSEYQNRRLRLGEQIKGNVLVLKAAQELELVEYYQEKNFFYLTGFDEPDATLLLDATQSPVQEVLFIPARDLPQERWTGVKLGPGAEAERATGFTKVLPNTDLQKTLASYGEAGARILGLKDVEAKIAAMRQVKSAFEIATMEKAIAATTKGIQAAARTIKPGAWEYEVEAALEYEFRKNGAERPGFPSIIGSGLYSTILHYNANTRRMQPNETVVVDVGAEYSGYSADVTRTFPTSGKFTPRQREIYQIVLDAQKAAIAKVKPGVTIRDVHAAAMEYIKSKGYEKYFIHGTSHHLGLDVHDVGDTRRPLEAGMVITVEPGIYIPEEQLGVRIEDDFLVTTTGSRYLSPFPKEIAEIEALMK
jgi:Xaa-Pro aminopeptidase